MGSFNGRLKTVLRRSLHLISWYWPGTLRNGTAAGLRSCECLPFRKQKHSGPSSPEDVYLSGLQLSGQVVYDIGAHIGIFTLVFARQVGARGCVLAFEPYRPNFRRLQRNLKLNRTENVIPVNAAVGATTGRRVMASSDGEPGRVTLSADAAKAGMSPIGEAQTVSLDAFLQDGTHPLPDFIKIDVEGLEWEVLQGATELLRRHHPSLLIELHGTGEVAKRANARKVLAFLHELGYSVQHVESGARITPAEDRRVLDGHLAACAMMPHSDAPAGRQRVNLVSNPR